MRKQRVKKAAQTHPYHEYEGTPLWRVVTQGIADLVENRDIEERTGREHIVGYLCKLLARRKKALLSI
jgi:hypothetical protein